MKTIRKDVTPSGTTTVSFTVPSDCTALTVICNGTSSISAKLDGTETHNSGAAAAVAKLAASAFGRDIVVTSGTNITSISVLIEVS